MALRPAALLASLAIATLARADVEPRHDRHEAELENGLRVVIAADPTVTSVVVHVRYATGAGDETAAQAGFTSVVEKLFALGTVHTKPGEHERRIDAAGGWTTSTTTIDDLTLVTEVPAAALELALWLEAERMAGLADGITADGLVQARASVAAAYRAAYVDQPYALVEREVRRALWQSERNGHDVLGDGVTVEQAGIAEIRTFARSRIQPGAATLVITGNVNTDEARRLVRRYFAWIPGKRDRHHTTSFAPSAPNKPIEVEIRDAMPKIVVAYRTPYADRRDPGTAVLSRMLSGDRTSRLYVALVATGLATDARADVVPHRGNDELQVHVAPAPSADPRRIAALVRSTVARAAREVSSAADAERARRSIELERLLVLETLAGRAHVLSVGGFATTPSTTPRDEEQNASYFDASRPVTVIARQAAP